MFRFLADRHDRKHALRSVQRQKRIAHKAIEFKNDPSLAFAVNAAEGHYTECGELGSMSISEAELFFSPILPADPLNITDNTIVFQSDISTEDKKNNTFECIISDSGSKKHAVVVFHHWYARNRYKSFSKFFSSRGITVIEATLPYHFSRSSDEFSEENLFNANLSYTVRAVRQAVLDGRKIVRWLDGQGYEKISVVGMCLGGTVAGLIAAYEEKVDKAVLMVTAGSPADLVWSAETMKPLRNRIERNISLEDLKSTWNIINLDNLLFGLTRRGLDLMFVLGKNDTIVRPEVSEKLINQLKECDTNPKVLRLNCGHSSIGNFPYNILSARRVLRFLKETPTIAELWEVRGFRFEFTEGWNPDNPPWLKDHKTK